MSNPARLLFSEAAVVASAPCFSVGGAVAGLVTVSIKAADETGSVRGGGVFFVTALV